MLKKFTKLFIVYVCITNIFTTTAFATTANAPSSNPQTVASDSSWPAGPNVTAESAILMDANTGTILYEKNPHDRNYPASITKIMTVLLTIENCSLDDVVTFSKNAVFDIEPGSSSLCVNVGEQLTVEQCLYAIMLISANDVSYGIAEKISGSTAAFADLMNKKAAALGCKDTHFTNPHGLQDENHYTSAYDMAIITKAALQNETFRKISSTKQYTINPTNIQTEARPLSNHHKMLVNSSYTYDGCEGGKTGYTTDAGNTLVTYAKRGNLELICVVMKDSNPEHYTDTASLLDWGFDNFKVFNISQNETKHQNKNSSFFKAESNFYGNTGSMVSINSKATIVLPKAAAFSNATPNITWSDHSSSSSIGLISYTYANKLVGSATIECTNSKNNIYQFDNSKNTIDFSSEDSSITDSPKTRTAFPFYFIFIVAVIIGIVLLFLFFLMKKYDLFHYERRQRLRRYNRRVKKKLSHRNRFNDDISY